MLLHDTDHYKGLIEITKADKDIIPLFLKSPDGDITIIPAFSKEFTGIQEGSKLAYLGKKFTQEDKKEAK